MDIQQIQKDFANGVLISRDTMQQMIEALVEQATRQAAPDEYQQFIDSLDSEDKMFAQIEKWARESFVHHRSSIRGQQVTAADSETSHIIWATLRWAKEQVAPSDLHTAVLALPLPNADIDGYCGEPAYSRECVEDFRHAIAVLVAGAAPVQSAVAVPPEVTNALAAYNADSTNAKAHAFVCIVEDWLEIMAAVPQPAAVVPEAVKLAGAKMANTMFNLSQDSAKFGHSLCASMKAMQVEWDAAIRAAHQPESKP